MMFTQEHIMKKIKTIKDRNIRVNITEKHCWNNYWQFLWFLISYNNNQ
jgi:hypothetical protein